MDMKLKIDKYGTIIDTRTNNTLLVSGVALPCYIDRGVSENAEYIVKCVNEYPELVEKARLLELVREQYPDVIAKLGSTQ